MLWVLLMRCPHNSRTDVQFASHVATLPTDADSRCQTAAAACRNIVTCSAALQGMHNDLRAPALLALAALAAAGQADGVAAEVVHGPNFMGQNEIRELPAVHCRMLPPCGCSLHVEAQIATPGFRDIKYTTAGRPGCSHVHSERLSALLLHGLQTDCTAWPPVRVLGCGPAAVAATASLIRELAVRGGPDLVEALLQHG